MAHDDFGDMIPRWEHGVLVVKYPDESDDGNEEMVSGYLNRLEIFGQLPTKKFHYVKFSGEIHVIVLLTNINWIPRSRGSRV